MHLLHNLPANGLSGLFFDFASVLIWKGNPLGTPFRTALQFAQCAAFGFCFLKCTLVLPPGTFLNSFLKLLDLNLGAGIALWKECSFIKVIVGICISVFAVGQLAKAQVLLALLGF